MNLLLKYLMYILLFLLPFLTMGQNEAKQQYYKAIDLSNNGDHYGAIEMLNLTIAANPDFAKAYAQRARFKMLLHQYDAANIDYNKALELNAEFANSYGNFGPLKALTEDSKGFIYAVNESSISKNHKSELMPEILKSSLKQNDYRGFDSSTYLEKAFLKYLKEDFSGAEKEIKKALAIDSLHTYAYYLTGCIKEKQNKLEEALKLYSHAIQIDSTFYLHYYKRAVVYKKLKNYEASIKDLYSAEKLNNSNELIFYNRSIIYMTMNDWENALKDLNQCLTINKNFSDAYFNRAYIRKQLADYKGALEDYNIFVLHNPQDPMVYNNRANLFMQKGEYVLAKEDYNLALSMAPDLGHNYLNRGISNIITGNKAEACLDFRTGADLGNQKALKKQLLYCY